MLLCKDVWDENSQVTQSWNHRLVADTSYMHESTSLCVFHVASSLTRVLPLCAGKSIVLIGDEDLPLLLRRLQTDKHLQSRVLGILVTSGSSQVAPKSPAERFPLAAYAPYEDTDYAWNPTGTKILSLDISIPIFHLEVGLQARAQGGAMQNGQQVMTPVGALCSCQSRGPWSVHECTFVALLSFECSFNAVMGQVLI